MQIKVTELKTKPDASPKREKGRRGQIEHKVSCWLYDSKVEALEKKSKNDPYYDCYAAPQRVAAMILNVRPQEINNVVVRNTRKDAPIRTGDIRRVPVEDCVPKFVLFWASQKKPKNYKSYGLPTIPELLEKGIMTQEFDIDSSKAQEAGLTVPSVKG